MAETTVSALTEDQASYVSGLVELAGWLSRNPDGIPELAVEKLLLPLNTNAAVEDFAARHGLTASYNDEGNASVDVTFGRVKLHAYGYVDFAEHWEHLRQRDAESFAAEHGLALVPTDDGGAR